MPTLCPGRRSHWTPEEGEKPVLSQVKALGGSQPVWTWGLLRPPHLAPQAPHRTAVKRGSFNGLWSLPIISHMGCSFSSTSLFHRNLQFVKDIKCIHSVQTHWAATANLGWQVSLASFYQQEIEIQGLSYLPRATPACGRPGRLVPRTLTPSTMAAPGGSAPTGAHPSIYVHSLLVLNV